MFENDLAFLRRLTDEYGYGFNVRGKKLVFWHKQALRKGKTVHVITRLNCVSPTTSRQGADR